MGLFAMTTGLVEQPTSVFPATRTTAFYTFKKGGQFAALHYGQFRALRVLNLKRYTMVCLSVFSTLSRYIAYPNVLGGYVIQIAETLLMKNCSGYAP